MMTRRFNIKMLVSAIVLVTTMCVSAFAALKSVGWSLNPADFRYDMSLYFALADRSLEDLDKYEIAAFVDDDCRGVAEKLELTGGESCLYMRIRSNSAQGANIEFRMRERGAENYVVLKPEDGADFIFKSNDRVGMPSSPFVLARYFNVEISSSDFGTVEPKSGLYREGTQLTLKASPNEGYSFSQWSDGDKHAERTLTVEGNISLTAFFEVATYTITFSIDDEVLLSQNLAFGTEIVVPEAPAKEGYTFSGWSECPATMPAHDVVVKGSYAVSTYTVTYNIDNELFTVQTYEFGAPIVTPEVPEKEGHTFSGWGDVPATMPAFDLVLGGTYADNYYTVTFRLEGVVIFTDDVAFEAPIVAPDVPEKEGYTFSGWGNVPETMPASDLNFDGSYLLNYYKLVFRIGDEIVSEGLMGYGAEIAAPDAPVKEGYTFAGWGVVPPTMPASDLEISGSYDVNIYTLTFMLDNEVYSSVQVPYGSDIPLPETPFKEGHLFSGWAELPSVMPAHDVVVAGSFSVGSYLLTFRIGDDVIFSGMMTYGSEIIAPDAPVKEGHTFAGWGDVPATMPAHDLEFVGAYDVNEYTLTFDIDGVVYQTLQLPFGASIEVPVDVPEKEGHAFMGWGDVPATMPANDLTISGTYAANHYTLTFRIGDEILFTGEQPFGSDIVAPEVPEKEGHTFSGWGDVPATMPARNLEITGSYDVNHYSLTFKIDGEVIYSESIAYGAEISEPLVVEKEGYSFSGWGVVPTTMPASDLEFTGTYEVNIYNVVFKIGDEVVLSAQLPFGSEISVPDAPEKEGYSFAGWGDVPATVPARDLEFNGSYDVNYYKVTFTIDGEVVLESEVAFGSEINFPEVPEKEGYTFVGWGVLPTTMPAHDLEITGSYNINHYRLVVYLNEDVYMEATLPYGAEIVVPDPVLGEDKIFKGWNEEIPATMPAHDVEIHGVVEDNPVSAVSAVVDSNASTVYSLDGVLLFKGVNTSEIKDRLTPGIYVINGKKTVVK